MQVRRFSGQVAITGLMIALGACFTLDDASAASKSHHNGTRAGAYQGHYAGRGASVAGYGRRYGGGLQCVPFARENTGIELAGNAANWWDNAEGVYQRGARPEVGSVLNFRANGRMRMGHVAVVSNVVNGRSIEIDHANWAGPGAGHGSITRNITVVDVSPNNDWTAVRVALGHTSDFGSVYPTFGFIYDRPDKGILVVNDATASAPVLAMNAAPRDLRPAAQRYDAMAQEPEEVAEAADDVQPRFRRVSSRHTVHGSHARHEMVSRGKYGSVQAVSARTFAPASASPRTSHGKPAVTKAQGSSAAHSHHGKRST